MKTKNTDAQNLIPGMKYLENGVVRTVLSRRPHMPRLRTGHQKVISTSDAGDRRESIVGRHASYAVIIEEPQS